jgi:hypothetical protein
MTSQPSEPRKPDGFVAKHLLLITATLDQNLSQGDLAVFGILVQCYFEDSKRSFASHMFLVGRTGLTRVSVIRSLKRLSDQGYIRVLSAGRRGRAGQPGRATEYAPSFHLAQDQAAITFTPKGAFPGKTPICIADDTVPDCIKPDTVEGVNCIADDKILGDFVASAIPQPTPPPAPNGKGGVGRNKILPPGVGTPGVGIPTGAAPGGADPRDTSAGRFEELYEVYGVNRDWFAAESAYRKMAPESEFEAELIEAAGRWRKRYDEIERAAPFRKSLHNWLSKKHYTEDLPAPHIDPKTRRTRKPKKTNATKAIVSVVDAEPLLPPAAAPAPTVHTTRAPLVVRVVDADAGADDASAGRRAAWVQFEVGEGEFAGHRFDRLFRYQADDGEVRHFESAELAGLCKAAGMGRAVGGDFSPLVGSNVIAERHESGHTIFSSLQAQEEGAA